MYKSQFDRQIQNNFIYKAVFFYGQSAFFINHYKDLMINKISTSTLPKIIYFEEYDFQECSNFLSQPSLFDEQNILIIKTQGGLLQKEIQGLVDISCKNQNAYLIIQYYPNESSSSTYQKEKKHTDSLMKSFSKNDKACFVRFFKPTLGEALEELNKKAKEINLNISLIGIKFLYQYHHSNLELAFNELPKLALLNKDITNDNIKETSFWASVDEHEDIFINILENKPFLLDMQRLLEHKAKEIEFIRNFCDFILNLILFNIYIKNNGSFDSKAILGIKLPQHIEEQRAKLAIKHKLHIYTNILSLMQKLELKIKTNNYIDSKMFLYSSFATLQTKL